MRLEEGSIAGACNHRPKSNLGPAWENRPNRDAKPPDRRFSGEPMADVGGKTEPSRQDDRQASAQQPSPATD